MAALLTVTTLMLSVTPIRVIADGGSSTAAFLSGYIKGDLYLYQPGTQPPLDVTQTYQTYGYVFDTSGNPLHIRVDDPTIFDLNGNVVGFVGQ